MEISFREHIWSEVIQEQSGMKDVIKFEFNCERAINYFLSVLFLYIYNRYQRLMFKIR